MVVLTALAGLVAATITAMAVYLLALSAAALVKPVPVPGAGPGRRLFAILVPAHDEAALIGRLLASLRVQRYDRDRFDVFVVADNCSDATADLARQGGAIVHERRDAALRAKGYALRWLLDLVRLHRAYDAYVIFDADSEVPPDFLARMDARLEAGAFIVQSYYRVLNANASPVAALREAALASLHYLRPLGRSALGLSCGLKGNGMCFSAETLDLHGWRSAGLAEDVELHLALLREGLRVEFAPEAVVRADMPTTLRESWSQNVRWEAGRLTVLRRDVIPVLRAGIARRDPVLLDAAAEQLIPPLSVAVAMGSVCFVIGAVAGNAIVVALATAGTAGLMIHVVAGLAAIRAPATVYRALLFAPAYAVWKLSLYARAAIAPAGHAWVRTQRAPTTEPRAPR
jgi:cellulose synthase/poly-beta-1,6-N-acetylglucosamine synthase-like glycosyltransferase